MKDYAIVYQTTNVNGPGLASYGNIIENAPSQQAVVDMFNHIMNGPNSQIWECREATQDDHYRRCPYIDISKL